MINEAYLLTAYSLYKDLLQLHKLHCLEADANQSGNIIKHINAINSKYQANYCNALTDIIRRWKLQKFIDVTTSDEINYFYNSIWKIHKKYAVPGFSDPKQAKDLGDETTAFAARYRSTYGDNTFVKACMHALSDEIEFPSLTPLPEAETQTNNQEG